MYMRIYCDYCGQTWEIYSRDDLTSKKARTCPHCGAAKIKPGTWDRIVQILELSKLANEQLVEDHINDHNALFSVSFIDDHLFSCPVSGLKIPDRCPNIN